MPVLNASEIQQKLTPLPGWALVQGEIVRNAAFKDFIAAMTFVNRVASLAEQAGHHPDIDIRYNKVRLALVSHDAGGITEKDFGMANEIETILRESEKG